MTVFRKPSSSLFCLGLAAIASVAGAASLELLPPTNDDLVPVRLTASAPVSAVAPPADIPIQSAWALDTNVDLAARPEPPESESRSYWFATTAAELERGVAIDTTAAGAVIRVNPLDPIEASLDPRSFVVVDETKRVLADGSAMETLVSADRLAESDSLFPSGTAAFRLRADLGAGRFVLSIPDLNVDGSSRLVVHVFEPASTAVARLTGSSAAHLAGEQIEVEATLSMDGEPVATEFAEASLIAPNGKRSAIGIVKRDRSLVARTRVVTVFPGAGLWEIEVRMRTAVGDRAIRRTVRTAFAVASPTARFDGRVERIDGDSLTLRLGIETAAAGRYEVRGILWGTTADGAMVPVAVGDSAVNIGAGRGELEITFAHSLLARVHAPYELRDLQLVDQTRMGVLHRQARALIID